MKQILYILTVICSAALAVTACRGDYNAADDIATAERAVDARDYPLARSICETFVTDSTTTLGVGELCRLSLVYMKLSDIENPDLNTAAATQCYHSAMHADSDSASAFYDSVPIDEARHVEIMSQLDRILNGSRDIYIDDDSISIEIPENPAETEVEP